METEKKKMTRDEVTAMLKTRTKADGTPFKKHEGPRKRKAVTAEGLKSALSAVQDNTARIQLVQAFGIDGRRALSELADTDEGLKPLLRAAFPGAGTGRPYQDSIKTTVDGKAVVSGFDNSVRVKVQRNEDGTVVLSPLAADSAEAKALDAADAALAQYALAQ